MGRGNRITTAAVSLTSGELSLKDRFSDVLGARRGNNGRGELAAKRGEPSTGAGERELQYLMSQFIRGVHEPAFIALKEHANSINERPLLLALRDAIAEQIVPAAKSGYVDGLRAYFDHTQLLPSEALCFVKDKEGVLHLWEDGEKYPCTHEPALTRITCECGVSIVLPTDGKIPRGRIGEWRNVMEHQRCEECNEYKSDYPICKVPSTFHMPLPKALDPAYTEFLEKDIREELIHTAYWSADSREWIRVSEMNAVQAASLKLGFQMMKSEPYGERAVQRTLGRSQYNRFQEDLVASGYQGTLASLITSSAWWTISAHFLPDEPLKAQEMTEDKEEIYREALEMALAQEIDTLAAGNA